MLSIDCTMSCTPGVGCSGCEQNITTRCESQECTCHVEHLCEGCSGCTGSISFENKE